MSLSPADNQYWGDGDGLVYFLHIPKTAGTSLYDFLSLVGGPGRVSPPMLWDDLVRDPGLLAPPTRIVGGHLGGLLPLWAGRWPTILTLVRDPVARTLSHINHVRRHPEHPLHATAAGLSVADYLAHPVLRTTVDDYQARHLASLAFASALMPATPGPPAAAALGFDAALYALDPTHGLRDAAVAALDRIDAVGVAEHFGDSLRLFARVLGWGGEVREARRNASAPGQPTVADLTPGEVAAIRDRTAVDAAVYAHAVARFRDLCRRWGVVSEPGPPPTAGHG